MSMDVEYAIKQDIRNNRVVREIDREQKREFIRTIGVWSLIVLMLLFSALQGFTVVRHGMEVERQKRALTEALALQRKLKLDLEVWRSPHDVEARAMKELHMVAPLSRDTLVLERARTSEVSSTIVAANRSGGR